MFAFAIARRRLTTINRWLKEHGYDVAKLWDNIDDAIIKTLISCQPVLRHNYRTCFPQHIQPGATRTATLAVADLIQT